MTRQNRKARWWKDPLVHVVVLGAGIFGLHHWLAPTTVGSQIVLSDALVRGLRQEHVRRTGNEPTAQETTALIDQYLRNEILYREALAQGLDRGDIIVRRRLVQKMEFLLENLEPSSDPTEADLQRYLDTHAERYAIPERISFTQVFVSTDRHGADTPAVAAGLLELLRDGRDASTLGDPFLHGNTVTLRTRADLIGLFGEPFVAQLGTLPMGEWSQPITSSFGTHIVRITDRRASRLPALTEVRTAVLRDWQEEQRAEANQRAIERLRQHYDVRVEAPHTTEVATLR